MGDQVGQTVEGTLRYIPYGDFQRVRGLKVPREQRAAVFADMCRFNALYMIARAGSGHIGSSFSSLDIVSWLFLEELRLAETPLSSGDIFFSSKGHDAPGYYSVMLGMGRLQFDLIHKLRRSGGLPGHPDVSTPGVATNTGSLGMGISKAKGMVLANRLAGRGGRVFVLTGDGELQEGQFWESLISAANHRMHEIVAVIDHNKLQSDTFVGRVSDLGDLEAKLRAFGWRVERCNGHDAAALAGVLETLAPDTEKPKIVIADTIKGRGVSFMEHTSLDSDVAMYKFHSGAPDASSYLRATQEILDRIQARLRTVDATPLNVEPAQPERAAVASPGAQRLIPAYTRALIAQAERHQNLVALDADLVLDTGLISFRERFPGRFFECGIAEQDMVSTAGGLALKGMLPVVHSFACFLSSRPNEQIYNNATERTRIVYVGSLAGVVPGGPGHSHQAVRDISALGGVPGLTMVEPCCESEVGILFDWCVNDAPGSCYLRLVSVPWDIPYVLPGAYRPQLGQGVVLSEGKDLVIVGYGPVLLSCATEVANKLRDSHRLTARVINLPWLNFVDHEWLAEAVSGYRDVFCLDNHYHVGGQGDRIADAMASGVVAGARLHRIALETIPTCGNNVEVLRAHGFDTPALLTKLLAAL